MALKAKGYNEFIHGTKDDLRPELAEKKAIDLKGKGARHDNWRAQRRVQLSNG